MNSLTTTFGVLQRCRFPGYLWNLIRTGGTHENNCGYLLSASFAAPDSEKPDSPPVEQKTRQWYIAPDSTDSQIVQTALKCILTSVEHEARECFRYNGKAIFGPHLDAEFLWTIADMRDEGAIE